MTVREAEEVLRVQLKLTEGWRRRRQDPYRDQYDPSPAVDAILASRDAAGSEILAICYSYIEPPQGLEGPDENWHSGWVDEHLDLILPLLSFGAPPDANSENTPLYFVTTANHHRAPEIATLLISAGADVDAAFDDESHMNIGGNSPLARALIGWDSHDPFIMIRFQIAKVLIDAGCDVATANTNYMRQRGYDFTTILEVQYERFLDPRLDDTEDDGDESESVDLDALKELTLELIALVNRAGRP